METLEKKADAKVKVVMHNIQAVSIKTPAYGLGNGYESRLGVHDMAEYSCDAACDNCHCATF
ncbi:MAG: hypothetical protein KKA64_04400 [Nanoarchaeota archaeon]|nr:hypothetical protein [Nanoarchaeota archaeon]